MKYLIGTENDEVTIYNVLIKLTDSQIVEILSTFGSLFRSKYSDDFYFIETTEEKMNTIKELEFVTFVEKYNELYFSTENSLIQIINVIEELRSINESIEFDKRLFNTKIHDIVKKLNKLKK